MTLLPSSSHFEQIAVRQSLDAYDSTVSIWKLEKNQGPGVDPKQRVSLQKNPTPLQGLRISGSGRSQTPTWLKLATARKP